MNDIEEKVTVSEEDIEDIEAVDAAENNDEDVIKLISTILNIVVSVLLTLV